MLYLIIMLTGVLNHDTKQYFFKACRHTIKCNDLIVNLIKANLITD